MSYTLGVDIGTTFTAAATLRQGQARIVPLGGTTDTIPSVVLVREDGSALTGEAAARRGITEPHRIAREFKRRFGQPEPVLLGGAPYSPEALTALLLRAVLDTVEQREGGPPTAICLSHPANWGPFKVDLFHHVVRLSGTTVPVTFTTEPEAAAVAYAREERVELGSVVAVYDLGGGTFDAAVLGRTAIGFDILGRPEGIEQLGGIDVDAAVFHHVTQALGDRLAELDEDDPAAVAAVARLKRECVEAKEALSSDTDVAVPVLLPGLSTEVRLTRAELEAMVRPMLGGTLHALRRALESAHVSTDNVGSVLLVGGSSRMPVVAQLVGAELGRPVAVDVHPKHVVALGAAWLADRAARKAEAPERPTPAPPPPADPAEVPAAAATARVAEDRVAEPTLLMDAVRPAPPPPPTRPARPAPEPRPRRLLAVLAALVVVALVAAGVLLSGVLTGDDPGSADDNPPADPKAALDAYVEDDRPGVEERLLDQWAPQLDVRKAGVQDEDGKTYEYPDILAEHEDLRERYDVLLVATSDFPAAFSLADAYATMVDRTFGTPEEVLAWCADEGFVSDDCFAKRVSRTGRPADHIMFQEDLGDPGAVVPEAEPTDEPEESEPVEPEITDPTDVTEPPVEGEAEVGEETTAVPTE